MTPNSENAMARFLMAILNQKNLKDIDWNKVANDPVLLQPITNGHAARMRFSRFRTTVNQDPQKRNRISDTNRITKPTKKAPQTKRDSLVKLESGDSLLAYAQAHSSPKVKREPSRQAYLAQFSPASNPSPYLADTADDFNTRFLTPCSDDVGQTLPINPMPLEDLRQRNGFGPSADVNNDFMNQAGQDPSVLGRQSPVFQAFDNAYALSTYKMDTQNPDGLDFNTHQSLADCEQDWPDRFPDPRF